MKSSTYPMSSISIESAGAIIRPYPMPTRDGSLPKQKPPVQSTPVKETAHGQRK